MHICVNFHDPSKQYFIFIWSFLFLQLKQMTLIYYQMYFNSLHKWSLPSLLFSFSFFMIFILCPDSSIRHLCIFRCGISPRSGVCAHCSFILKCYDLHFLPWLKQTILVFCIFRYITLSRSGVCPHCSFFFKLKFMIFTFCPDSSRRHCVFSGVELSPEVESALIAHWQPQVPDDHDIVVSLLFVPILYKVSVSDVFTW